MISKEDLEKAQEKRRDKKKYAEENLTLDYGSDEDVWKSLASKYNTRLPIYYQPNTETKYIRRLFKHLSLDIQEYLEYCGVKTLKELVSLNPTYTARAEVGFALEYAEEKLNN